MQTLAKFGLIPLLCFTVAACSNPKAASKENFAKSIATYYKTEPTEQYCVMVTPIAQERKFPVTLSEKTNMSTYLALTDAGLLDAKETTQANAPAGKAKMFDLTSTGKKYFKEGKKQTGFCYAEPKVEVISFTEPADAMGHKISNVKYKLEFKNVADWTNNKMIQTTFLNNSKNFADDKEGSIALILTDDGWTHQDLLK